MYQKPVNNLNLPSSRWQIKTNLAIAVAAFVTCQSAWGAVIWTNPITDTNPSLANPYTNGQTVDANLTVSGIGRGGGLTAATASNRYNASAWSTASTLTTSNNDYFTFTLTANAGYEIGFSSFVYTGQASSGTPSFSIRSSLDSFGSSLAAPSAAGTTLDLTSASYQHLSTIEFRVYGYNFAAGTTTYSINDFTFNGAVSLVGVSNYSYFDTNGTTAGSGVTGAATAVTVPAVVYNLSTSVFNTAADGTGAAGTFTTGQTATFSAGGDATGFYTVNVDTGLSASGLSFEEGNVTLAAGGGTLTLTGGAAVTVASGTTATIAPAITSSVGLTKNGAGTLVITGDNTYTGTTTVASGGGTLQIGAGGTTGSISSNIATNSGTTVAFNRSNDLTYAGAITGAGAVTKAGAGTLILTGANAYTGTTIISSGGGTLQVGAGGTSGALGTGNITNNGALVFNRSDSYTYAGAIAGSGTVTQTVGTLTLSGTSTYTGATSVSAGILNVTGSLSNTSGLTLSSGTTLASGVATTINGTTTAATGVNISPNGGGVGALTLGGLSLASGTSIALTLSTASSYDTISLGGSGILTLAAGTETINLSGTAVAGTNYTLLTYGSLANPGNAFVLGTTPDASLNYTLTTTATATTLSITGNSYSFFDTNGNAAASGIADGGVYSTSGSFNTLADGTGTFGNFSAGQTATFSAGADGAGKSYTVNVNSAISTNGLSFEEGNATLVSAGGSITLTGASVTVAGTASAVISQSIGGSVGLNKQGNGSLTLASANAYTGGTTLTAGTLNVNNASALPAGTMTIAGGTLDNTSGSAITMTNSNAQTWSGDFTFTGTNDLSFGSGAVSLTANRSVNIAGGTLTVGSIGGSSNSLTKTGAGTLAATALSYTGQTIITGGVLSLSTSNISASTALSSNLQIGGGTFKYVGPGNNSGRAFQINTGGATIDGSGTGAFAFTSTTVPIGFGSPGTAASLTLTGTNTNSNTIAPVIADNGVGLTSVTKSGAGKWVLSNANNSYSGGTNITGGTLLSNGGTTAGGTSATGSGPITIGSGGTLGGTARAAGPITVDGTITAGSGATAADTTESLDTGDQKWDAGGTYVSKFATSTATSGGTTGSWDVLAMGALDLTALSSSNTFNLTLLKTTAGTFTQTSVKTFVIATTSGISYPDGYSAANIGDLFTLNTDGLGASYTNESLFTLSSSGGNISITYDQNPAPEPTTAALFSLGGSVLLGRRRRKSAGGLVKGLGRLFGHLPQASAALMSN